MTGQPRPLSLALGRASARRAYETARGDRASEGGTTVARTPYEPESGLFGARSAPTELLLVARERMAERMDRMSLALRIAERELGYVAEGQVDGPAIEKALREIRAALREG